MNLAELNTIADFLNESLPKMLLDHSQKVEIGYPDSPNPLCYFEIKGQYFVQGSFWSNNEYNLEAIDTEHLTGITSDSGTVSSPAKAIKIIQRFCKIVTGSGFPEDKSLQ
jgi:hypothetical protein